MTNVKRFALGYTSTFSKDVRGRESTLYGAGDNSSLNTFDSSIVSSRPGYTVTESRMSQLYQHYRFVRILGERCQNHEIPKRNVPRYGEHTRIRFITPRSLNRYPEKARIPLHVALRTERRSLESFRSRFVEQSRTQPSTNAVQRTRKSVRRYFDIRSLRTNLWTDPSSGCLCR